MLRRFYFVIALDESPEPNSLLDNAAWKAAVTLFNEHFMQAEQEAGTSLRPRLISAGDDPSAVSLNKNWKQLDSYE